MLKKLVLDNTFIQSLSSRMMFDQSQQSSIKLPLYISLQVGVQNREAIVYQQLGGLAQMVERSLSMREAPGSIPGSSILFLKYLNPHFLLLIQTNCLVSTRNRHSGACPSPP
ncbi:hypothetical protein FGO68_gene9659 [Halteria grandinella]|uniref:Uncharacterized protein n=1 Tax=Halteria grandinella TaxID=5974 RepID=A0A8J8NH60_HALGN|nr:hypothetical protein FGO68_gene9659 [Halteria grandinella]